MVYIFVIRQSDVYRRDDLVPVLQGRLQAAAGVRNRWLLENQSGSPFHDVAAGEGVRNVVRSQEAAPARIRHHQKQPFKRQRAVRLPEGKPGHQQAVLMAVRLHEDGARAGGRPVAHAPRRGAPRDERLRGGDVLEARDIPKDRHTLREQRPGHYLHLQALILAATREDAVEKPGPHAVRLPAHVLLSKTPALHGRQHGLGAEDGLPQVARPRVGGVRRGPHFAEGVVASDIRRLTAIGMDDETGMPGGYRSLRPPRTDEHRRLHGVRGQVPYEPPVDALAAPAVIGDEGQVHDVVLQLEVLADAGRGKEKGK